MDALHGLPIFCAFPNGPAAFGGAAAAAEIYHLIKNLTRASVRSDSGREVPAIDRDQTQR
jgi:hypothetical protein